MVDNVFRKKSSSPENWNAPKKLRGNYRVEEYRI